MYRQRQQMLPGLVLMFDRGQEFSSQRGIQRKHDDRPNGENELGKASQRIGTTHLLATLHIDAEDEEHDDHRAADRQA